MWPIFTHLVGLSNSIATTHKPGKRRRSNTKRERATSEPTFLTHTNNHVLPLHTRKSQSDIGNLNHPPIHPSWVTCLILHITKGICFLGGKPSPSSPKVEGKGRSYLPCGQFSHTLLALVIPSPQHTNLASEGGATQRERERESA